MTVILPFPNDKKRSAKGIARARRRWEAIPTHVRGLLLKNGYCRKCQKMTHLASHGVSENDGALILHGECGGCGTLIDRIVDS
ncbi:MAG: hypothetical protein ACLFSB_08365 [Chitinispirillaceae bacterium]